MSNAMTLQDLRNREAGNRGGQQRQQYQQRQAAPAQEEGGSRAIHIGGSEGRSIKHPRQENWANMWTTTFCPSFSVCSFTFINVNVQLLVYIFTAIYSGQTDQGLNEKWFLGNATETLKDFGIRIPYLIKKDAELWRLVMSLYLNHGFSQVIINCLVQLFSGSLLEQQMGSLRMMLFFFSAGISANLFAATVEDEYAAGAEPAMFAMLAGLIGMYCYYWNNISTGADENWCRKVCGLFIMIFMLVIGIFFLTSFAEPYKDYAKSYHIQYPDSMGFLGGFLFGFPMSWVFLPPVTGSMKQSTRRERGLFICGMIWTMSFLVLIIVLFSFESDPEYYSKGWTFADTATDNDNK